MSGGFPLPFTLSSGASVEARAVRRYLVVRGWSLQSDVDATLIAPPCRSVRSSLSDYQLYTDRGMNLAWKKRLDPLDRSTTTPITIVKFTAAR
ncbi:unnamed protein product [Heligmosomoides polygyrus]|uniref:Phage protein n=1 Tax=Heligmosomoides polygyrus TaxID=6339 RepID=A0A183FLV9_HELPZ|nr:unnamed protein product [Heligmosomoides polygyrus]